MKLGRLAWIGGYLFSMFALVVLLSARVALPAALTTAPAASSLHLMVDPARSKVSWTLSATAHTVHGTFRVKQGTLHLDTSTGRASGEIVVYATSGESGNSGRDEKMHREVLQSQKFAEIIFRPDRVDGS